VAKKSVTSHDGILTYFALWIPVDITRTNENQTGYSQGYGPSAAEGTAWQRVWQMVLIIVVSNQASEDVKSKLYIQQMKSKKHALLPINVHGDS
jgi:hypothetical protein